MKLHPDLETQILALPGVVINGRTAQEPPVDDSTSEKEFQAEVEAFARRHGWKCYHTRDSRKSVAGFPDLVMLRARREIVAELKVGKNKTDAAQDAWLEAFRDAGREVFLWYPDNWATIVCVLGVPDTEEVGKK